MLNEAQHVLRNRISDEVSLPDSHRETEVLLSFIYSLSGQIDDAKRAAIKGIETGSREKSGFVEAVGWIRRGHAEILDDPFDLETPENYYIKAVHRMEELNVSRGKAEPYMGLSLLKSRQGLFEDAISYGEKGLRETDKGNDYWLSAYILLCLTIVYFEKGEMEQAIQTAHEANRLFTSSGDVYEEMISHYWLMFIYAELGNNKVFVDHTESLLPFVFSTILAFSYLKRRYSGLSICKCI
ncbi:tetratricopeptide repeat protein [Psychrobacillus sp. L4]|uniref:tetratricopeptide repeat protein n=1 Tax=Psychrobacillus sp. L4 TaxID=3236892 RepID=UPI0036F1A881